MTPGACKVVMGAGPGGEKTQGGAKKGVQRAKQERGEGEGTGGDDGARGRVADLEGSAARRIRDDAASAISDAHARPVGRVTREHESECEDQERPGPRAMH